MLKTTVVIVIVLFLNITFSVSESEKNGSGKTTLFLYPFFYPVYYVPYYVPAVYVLQILLLLACYEFSSPMWLPMTKFRSTKPTDPPLLPSELTEDQLYRLKIPNKRLCDEMERQEGKYLLIPWLSQNCQDLKDDVAKKLSPGDILPIHKAVIDKLNTYRRSGLLKYNIRTHMPRNRKL